MPSDAPADPVAPDGLRIPENNGADTVRNGGDPVLVLSPGVTLTLGDDALLLSGELPSS